MTDLSNGRRTSWVVDARCPIDGRILALAEATFAAPTDPAAVLKAHIQW